jgi:hypothetical protein
MPAGIAQTQAAIAPGSTEYGERKNLEAGLSQAMGSAGNPTSGAQPASPVAPLPDNPLGALLSGEIPGDNTPVTDGLSIGPGAGPQNQHPMMSDRAQRLRTVATEAASPVARAAARRALRLMSREAI